MPSTAPLPAPPLASADIDKPPRWVHALTGSIFVAIHFGALAAIWTGVSVRSLVLCFVLYWLFMFAITGGYHRYFSHRTYKTSRWFQFVLAVLGTMTVQKGPLWWAARHRHHHKFSDEPEDVHSPLQRGFWTAHIGWILTPSNTATDLRAVKDLAKYPELRWIGKYHWLAPALMAVGAYLFDGWRGFIVGTGWALVLSWHTTFTINSLAHLWGTRRYPTTDTSRNNFLLALLTMGEGWHNNHHHYQHTVRQGFYWWEIDASYYVLRALAVVGIVWDLKLPPARVYAPQTVGEAAAAGGEEIAAESVPEAARALGRGVFAVAGVRVSLRGWSCGRRSPGCARGVTSGPTRWRRRWGGSWTARLRPRRSRRCSSGCG
jgi:stearoyl-CoA desaturase (delta-9 desaturase)